MMYTHSVARLGLEVGIMDVRGPQVKSIELCKEDNEPQSVQGHNSRVHTLNRDVGEVTVSNNKPRLVSQRQASQSANILQH